MQFASLLNNVRPAILASFLKKVFGVERVVLDTRYGAFWVDPVSNLGVRLAAGEYEPGWDDAFAKLLQPGSTFVDLGANEGLYSVIAAKIVGPTGRILAIEPQQRLAPVIERNLQLNTCTNVKVLSVAIADADGEATFYLSPDTNTGSSGLRRATRYALPTQTVKTLRLSDAIASDNLKTVDLIKIDIEGAEYEAIMGSRELFESGRVKAIALELHDTALTERNRNPADITAFLQRAGFENDPELPSDVWVWRK